MLKRLMVLCFSLLCAQSVLADDFVEKGSFGVLGAITDDHFKAGFVYQAESWEASLTGHYSVIKKNAKPDSIKTLAVIKAGGRKNLGSHNYFAYGVEYSAHPGESDQGVDVSDAYSLAPYIALQRYFAGTNLMLSLWVNPFNYNYDSESNGLGGKTNPISNQYFITGGFGVAYLF
ncbi:MAG: hypothetical protein K2X47_16790 [Bdellovibrionales bacterium]|nr:hypothetical protein [Bdellovibrionales bacterium]